MEVDMLTFLTPDNLRLLMGFTFFPIGLMAISVGLLMLGAGPYRKEAKMLAAQSARISSLKSAGDPKGFTDSLTAVTQSATALINAVNGLILTSSGNAIVLIVVGALLEMAAYWLAIAGV
jgi:hypothetical protein